MEREEDTEHANTRQGLRQTSCFSVACAMMATQ